MTYSSRSFSISLKNEHKPLFDRSLPLIDLVFFKNVFIKLMVLDPRRDILTET